MMTTTDVKNKWGRLIFSLLSLYLLYGCIQEHETGHLSQSEMAGTWFNDARELVIAKDYEKSLWILDSIIQDSTIMANDKSKGSAYHLKGYICRKQGNDHEALMNYYYALEVYKNLNDSKALSELLNNMGRVYEKNNNLEKALKNYQEAYNVLEGNPNLAMKILNNISITYKSMGAYDEALLHYNKALNLSIVINDPYQKGILYNNIGEAYWYKKEYGLAKKNYLQALRFHKESGKEQQVIHTLNNLALVYQETQQWDKALDYFQQSIQIKEKYNSPTLINGYNNLADLYQEKQDFQKANHYLDKALALNPSKLEDRSRTLELKSVIAEAQGKFQRSTDYQKQVVALKDSIYSKQDTINDLSYNNLQLVQERVERENTMHKERIDYQQQINRWVTIAVVVALVGITVITILYWRLRQATLTMDTYTKNMSHTMRNQFNAILGNAYLVKGLLKKMKVSPEEDIRPEAYEAIGSISDILQSSAETTTNIITTRHVGKVQAESDLYKPVRAVTANLKTYTPAAREKGIVLKEEILSTPSVTAHATTFEHALGNLVSNAIKYSPEGSTVTIRLYDRGNRVFLTVLDEGPGIPESDHKRLFKKGVKLHNMKNIVSSGVGLYYAKKSVEEMGGKMYHQNRKEGGSAFTIEFPKTI